MRSFVLTFAVIAAAFLAAESTLSAQQIVSSQPYVSSSTSYVCPKCGKIHAQPASVSSNSVSSPIQTVSYQSPTQTPTLTPLDSGTSLRASGGVANVLDSLNSQRARQGIRGLRYDAQLQAVAQQRAQQMASMGLKSHPPGSFAPGRYEGVGWSSSFSPSGVSACYTSDPGMQYAGAAMATGRDGVYFAVVYR